MCYLLHDVRSVETWLEFGDQIRRINSELCEVVALPLNADL